VYISDFIKMYVQYYVCVFWYYVDGYTQHCTYIAENILHPHSYNDQPIADSLDQY